MALFGYGHLVVVMLSQTCEYALRAIVYLAEDHGRANTAVTIAETVQVPLGYLSKVLNLLARGGLVQSQRGMGGGFTLLRSPAELTVYDVVICVEPVRRITACPLGIAGHTELCQLHRLLDNGMAAVEMSFRKTTIAQLLEERNGVRPLCSMGEKK